MEERPLISIVWRMLGHVGRLVSGSLPGSVHDMKAAWIWASEPELTAAGLPWPTRAIKAPCTRERPTAAEGNRNHRKRPTGYAKLRAPGERENAQLKACSRPGRSSLGYAAPRRAGHIAKAILVLQAHETKAG